MYRDKFSSCIQYIIDRFTSINNGYQTVSSDTCGKSDFTK